MIDPVILFFILGGAACLCSVSLRLPSDVYRFVSLYLLLAIGLKGGAELQAHITPLLAWQSFAMVACGVALTLVCFLLMRVFGIYRHDDASVIAAHYGSVSVGTYAVAAAFLSEQGVSFEPYMPLFVALLEFPAIIVGSLFLQRTSVHSASMGEIVYGVVCNKSMFALVGSVCIGYAAGYASLAPIKPLFFDMFKGVLALFLLEMGAVVGEHIGDIRRNVGRVIVTSLMLTIVGAACGLGVGYAIGLSMGGTVMVMTLCASASYIAVPASLRTSYPNANVPLALSHSLGVTFPFNVLIGIYMYYICAAWLFA